MAEDERFRVMHNPRSGYWEVRERLRGGKSRLRGRRLSKPAAEQAMATLVAQVRDREAGRP